MHSQPRLDNDLDRSTRASREKTNQSSIKILALTMTRAELQAAPYVLDSGTGTISVFGINQDGSLKQLGIGRRPFRRCSFNGIAAF